MTTPTRLDDFSVTAIAERVVELLRDEGVAVDLINAGEVARRFGVSRDYVYEHAEELGAVRLGKGTRGRLRFDPSTVGERLGSRAVRTAESQPQQEKQRAVRRTQPDSGNLLPIKGESP